VSGSGSKRPARLGLETLEKRDLPSVSFVPNELLIRYTPGATEVTKAVVRARLAAVLEERLAAAPARSGSGDTELVRLPAGLAVEAVARRAAGLPGVRSAEPNWIVTTQGTADDPYYANGSLWGMSGGAGSFGSQSETAWARGVTGSARVVVGIIDEGVDYRHPDLYRNIWINQGEIPDAVFKSIEDQDGDGRVSFYDLNYADTAGNHPNQGPGKITDLNGNGYIDGGDLMFSRKRGGWTDGADGPDHNKLVDDLLGWDFFANDASTYDGPTDDHGTHVAGTIGALGNNGVGVAGVNWDVTLVPVKFLGPNGGNVSNAVKSLNYLIELKQYDGVNVVVTNNSWGGGGYSPALHDALKAAADAGILFVAAAGNGGEDRRGDDNDGGSFYPANYDATERGAAYDNVIAVAALASNGTLATFSNYGSRSVDLGAPGVGIYSTLPDGKYGSYSGTSMATPHVVGAIALYASTHPRATAAEIKDAILNAVTPTASVAGRTATGGRVNAADIVTSTFQFGAAAYSVKEGGGAATITVTRTAAGNLDPVTVDFRTSDGTASRRDYTAVAGTLTFAAGETVKTITIPITADSQYEGDETILLTLSGPTGLAKLGPRGAAILTILDGSAPPVVSVSAASPVLSGVEVVKGVTRDFYYVEFQVTVTGVGSQELAIRYTTRDGTAVAASGDYQSASGTLTFAADGTQTVRVRVPRGAAGQGTTFFLDLFSMSDGSINGLGEAIL
jgi:subtilisin family serine protease